jgi:hypothetical protein
MNTCEIVEIKKKENSEGEEENSERKNFSHNLFFLSIFISFSLSMSKMSKKKPSLTPQKVNIHALKLTSYSTLRAVLEICDNAIEAAMSKGDDAEVKVSISGEHILTILDNGPGMTRDELEKSSALGGGVRNVSTKNSSSSSTSSSTSTSTIAAFGFGKQAFLTLGDDALLTTKASTKASTVSTMAFTVNEKDDIVNVVIGNSDDKEPSYSTWTKFTVTLNEEKMKKITPAALCTRYAPLLGKVRLWFNNEHVIPDQSEYYQLTQKLKSLDSSCRIAFNVGLKNNKLVVKEEIQSGQVIGHLEMGYFKEEQGYHHETSQLIVVLDKIVLTREVIHFTEFFKGKKKIWSRKEQLALGKLHGVLHLQCVENRVQFGPEKNSLEIRLPDVITLQQIFEMVYPDGHLGGDLKVWFTNLSHADKFAFCYGHDGVSFQKLKTMTGLLIRVGDDLLDTATKDVFHVTKICQEESITIEAQKTSSTSSTSETVVLDSFEHLEKINKKETVGKHKDKNVLEQGVSSLSLSLSSTADAKSSSSPEEKPAEPASQGASSSSSTSDTIPSPWSGATGKPAVSSTTDTAPSSPEKKSAAPSSQGVSPSSSTTESESPSSSVKKSAEPSSQGEEKPNGKRTRGKPTPRTVDEYDKFIPQSSRKKRRRLTTTTEGEEDNDDEQLQNIPHGPGTALNPILIEDQMTVHELIEKAIARDTAASASTTTTTVSSSSSTTATAALVPLATSSHIRIGNSFYQFTKTTRVFALSPKNTIWYYPGTIIDESDELYTIDYIDGKKREKVPRKEILIFGEDEGIHEKLKEDQEVAVYVLDDNDFADGKVSHCNEDGTYNISYKDEKTKKQMTRDNVKRFEIANKRERKKMST